MERTQIYITNEQRKALDEMKDSSGLNKSELIRRAIDLYLKEQRE